MKFPRTYSLVEISQILSCSYVGSETFEVLGLNEIHGVTHGDIVFVDYFKYYDKALQSEASVILIDKEVECPKGKALLISDNPFEDFNRLIDYFNFSKVPTKNCYNTAVIGKETIIQEGVFIGNDVTIGKNCIIYANSFIGDCTQIGDNVIIQSNSTIGSMAFYYKKTPNGHKRLKSCGNVVIQDNVDLGAGCTIDRGVTGSTVIGTGSKLDNQVHIGHDTVIGSHCILAAQVGIAGCSVLENNVTFWGQVGMGSGMKVGQGAVVLAQSGIAKSLKGDEVYFGSPADESRQRLKELATLRRLSKTKN